MKISDVKIIAANRYLFVKIYTNEGYVGLGESGAWGFLDASREALVTFKEYLLGKDPLEIENHWQYMYRCWHFRGAAIMGALSAIDIALWDIAGKFFDTPVYGLLGGKVRDKVRVYLNVGGRTNEEMVRNLRKAKDEGYTAVGHLSPFLDAPRTERYFEPYSKRISNAIERVGEYRDAVGDGVDLCLEIHRSLKPAEAISLANGIEKYLPCFIEDPTTPDNFDSMELIAKHISVPIATGERFTTPQEFSQLITRGAVSYVRPDVCMCGGITGAKKIAAIAEAYGVLVVPHNPLSSVSTAACLQVAASIPNFALLEYPKDDEPAISEKYGSTRVEGNVRKKDLVNKSFECEEGFIKVPDESGIGIELVEHVEKLFPYKRRPLEARLYSDGSVMDY